MAWPVDGNVEIFEVLVVTIEESLIRKVFDHHPERRSEHHSITHTNVEVRWISVAIDEGIAQVAGELSSHYAHFSVAQIGSEESQGIDMHVEESLLR